MIQESDNFDTENLQHTEGTPKPLNLPVKRKCGRPKGSGTLANLKPFDSERAKAISAKANAAKAARQEMRRRILATVCQEGIDKYVAKALRDGNAELMAVCEKAINMTGLNYRDSEDAVQNLHVTAETTSNVKADHSINITFTDAPSPTK